MAYIVGIAGLLNILLAIYVFVKNPNERNNRLFALVAFIIGIWVLSNILLFTDQRFEYPWVYLSYALGALTTPFILYWVVNLTNYWMKKWFLVLILFTSLIIFILTLIPNFVLESYFTIPETQVGFSVYPGILFPLYAIYVSFVLVLSLFILLKTRNESSGLKKIQLNYVLLGFGIPVVLIIFLDFILPLFGNTNYANIDSLTSFIFVGIIAYSITRYRFLDIKIVIRKGVIYTISLLFALAIYTYLALILKTTIEESWNVNPGWTVFLVVALVALGFPPLKSVVERSISTLFKGRKSIDLAVKELREKISEKTDLEVLIGLISAEIKKFLEVDKVKLFIIDHKEKKLVYQGEQWEQEAIEHQNELIRYFEKYSDVLIRDEIGHLMEEREGEFEREILQKAEKEMKKRKSSLAMPLKTEEEVFGLVMLGERSGDQAYTVQDVKFLERLREQVQFVLANAILYKEAVERVRETAVVNG